MSDLMKVNVLQEMYNISILYKYKENSNLTNKVILRSINDY